MKLHKYILLIAFTFFVMFSFQVELKPINVKIGVNDLSKEGVLDWMVYTLYVNLFLIFIGLIGMNGCKDKFMCRVFAAVMIDGFITIVRYLVFGYYEPFYIPALSNAIPMSYILYSYYVYGNRTE